MSSRVLSEVSSDESEFKSAEDVLCKERMVGYDVWARAFNEAVSVWDWVESVVGVASRSDNGREGSPPRYDAFSGWSVRMVEDDKRSSKVVASPSVVMAVTTELPFNISTEI